STQHTGPPVPCHPEQVGARVPGEQGAGCVLPSLARLTDDVASRQPAGFGKKSTERRTSRWRVSRRSRVETTSDSTLIDARRPKYYYLEDKPCRTKEIGAREVRKLRTL
ncbi:unnamed protein product, partial [Ascophyllum nodosum]